MALEEVMGVVQVAAAPGGQWQWGLESVGTIGAAVVALGIALREIFIRRAERKARARLAAMMIWPDLRKYMAALKDLRSHELLTASRLDPDRRVTVQRIVGALLSDPERVAAAARDFDQPHADMVARVIANVRHAVRHTQDMLIADGELRPSILEAKQLAVKSAIAAARVDLAPLIKFTRSVGSTEKRAKLSPKKTPLPTG